MKKLLFLLPITLLTLSACNNNKVSNSPQSEVELTSENVLTYVAKTLSSNTLRDGGTNSDVVYYCHFTGAEYCKFVDCVISYEYKTINDGSQREAGSCSLTLSGDGEASPFYAYQKSKGTAFTCNIVGASGKVLVYR